VTPRNDIAIYAPFASLFYEQASERSGESPDGGGGAELQTAILAAELARRGLRVAHIVYSVKRRIPDPPVDVVERPRPDRDDRGGLGRLAELPPTWRSLKAADARLYVLRGGGSLLLVIGALFCLVHRRVLVLSTSNDFDFLKRPDRSRFGQALSGFARKRAKRVIAQTEQQARLAREALGSDERIRLIRSFADPGPPRDTPIEPESFLWVGRVAPYKLPLEYLRLARALPELHFRMVGAITGDSSSSLLGEIEAERRDLSNLEMLPHLWREAVLELMDRSAAVVLTSEYEGMPNVFLEAWGRGVPVLSLHFDPDGVIAREGLGVYADGSRERLAEGARRLWDDASLRAEMGRRGRAYVARTHARDVVGQEWAETLKEALQG